MNGDARYQESTSFLELAEELIPLGAQTFSKSRTHYPVGYAPLFAAKGRKSHLTDIDGNKYIDLVAALASVSLGYSNRKIDKAVRKQLAKGVSLSLSGRLELEVAEKICNLVKSAEMVRFAKNGSDVTSAAVRVARAHTSRSQVISIGYHGWHDWYIGTTSRNKGVPREVSRLTHSIPYNNLNILRDIFLEQHGKIAAVIMEPMSSVWPQTGYLEAVRELCTQNGTLLIFDEVITGFRFSPGGAQEFFGVYPDLTAFGKGLANGFPLSALTGTRKVMKELEEVFFSGTFGGELLSLAAANSVLDLVKNGEVTQKLNSIGEVLSNRITDLINDLGINFLELSGHNSWKFLIWKNLEDGQMDMVKTYFLQEMMKEGILVLNTHTITTTLNDKDIHKIEKAYKNTLSKISKHLNDGTLPQDLRAQVIKPLFTVR